jgi:hypothetical protein
MGAEGKNRIVPRCGPTNTAVPRSAGEKGEFHATSMDSRGGCHRPGVRRRRSGRDTRASDRSGDSSGWPACLSQPRLVHQDQPAGAGGQAPSGRRLRPAHTRRCGRRPALAYTPRTRDRHRCERVPRVSAGAEAPLRNDLVRGRNRVHGSWIRTRSPRHCSSRCRLRLLRDLRDSDRDSEPDHSEATPGGLSLVLTRPEGFQHASGLFSSKISAPFRLRSPGKRYL